MRLSIGCVDTLDVTVTGGTKYANTTFGAWRTVDTPAHLLDLLLYEPLSGAVVGYVGAGVRIVQWRSPDGTSTLDAMRPWHGWIAELGPKVHAHTGPGPVPQANVGNLVALGAGNRVLATLPVSSAEALPLAGGRSGGCLPSQPARRGR
jgi:hypothetical protein